MYLDHNPPFSQTSTFQYFSCQMTYLLQPALLGCVDDVAGLSYLLESNQSLYNSEVNPIYNVADILVSSQSFPHQLLASELGI